MMGKLWQRYIFREFFKVFSFFLLGFYFLYVIIDYSTHMQDFLHGKNLSIQMTVQYYLFQFIKRADILLPLAILIATIKVLCQLNVQKELVALQVAGLSMKKLLRPLFFVSVLCSLGNLAIMEYAVPQSLNFIDKFSDANLRHSFRGNRTEPLHVMHLEDHSKLIYQYYDAAKESFFDVIWLKNPNDIWRMKYLTADPRFSQGEWVDHLVRNSAGSFENAESFPRMVFKDLRWQEDMPRKGFIPFENRSLSELWSLFKEDSLLSSYERNEVLTQILFKLAMPSFALLIVLALAPFCCRHSRNLSPFYLYGLSLFGFIAFITLMDGSVILGENETLSPYIAILTPFILLFGFFGWRFAKAR